MHSIQRVLLVDDHAVVRAGLAFLLDQLAGFSVCGEAATAANARLLAQRLQPDLIVLDLFLGGTDGLPLVAEIRAICPAAKILIYSAHDEAIYARRALLAGAHGFLMKTADNAAVFDALRTLAAGRHYVSSVVAEQLLMTSLAAGQSHDPLELLSDRELEVLRLTAKGKELGEIARALGVSVKTVGTHRERLKNKLGVRSARELAREAPVLLQRTAADGAATLAAHPPGR